MTGKTLSDLYTLVHIILRTTLWKRHDYYHHSHFTEGNWSRDCHVTNERQSQDSNSGLSDPKFLCLAIKLYSTSCPSTYGKLRSLVKRGIRVHRDLGSRSRSAIMVKLRPRFQAVDWKKMHNVKVENYVLFSRLSEDIKQGRQPLR